MGEHFFSVTADVGGVFYGNFNEHVVTRGDQANPRHRHSGYEEIRNLRCASRFDVDSDKGIDFELRLLDGLELWPP
jgi:hypothetical protein